MRKLNEAFFILSLIVFTISCSKKPDEAVVRQENINPAFLDKIKTERIFLSNKEEELTLTGKVEYHPDKLINYVPLTSGIVDKTYFSLGDKVKKGQPLLDLRSTELSLLQSELITLRAEVKIAERELKTVQALYDDNMSSEKELLEAQSKLDQAQASLRRTEADMSFYNYNPENGTFSVTAPMSGYVVTKNISSGSTISSGQEPIFTIADLSLVWITANVYAGSLLFVEEGMNAEITLLSYPGEVFNGKIDKVSQVFDPEEKVMKVRITMPNESLKFKPEMSVVVKLKKTAAEKLAAIPSDALVFDSNAYFAVVEKDENQFELRKVEIESRSNGTTYIASGLSEGERIVTENQLLIYSQLKDI